MPPFFLPPWTAIDEHNQSSAEQEYAAFVRQHGIKVSISPTQRIYSITWTADGKEWIATVGQRMYNHPAVQQDRERPASPYPDAETYAREPYVEVQAIIPGATIYVHTSGFRTNNPEVRWSNPLAVTTATAVTYFKPSSVLPERRYEATETIEQPNSRRLVTFPIKWSQYRRVLEVRDNPTASAERLRALSSDIAPPVRRHVAQHPNTPPDVLERLLEDEDRDAASSALMNPHLPTAALRQEAANVDLDNQANYLESIVRHPNTDDALRSYLLAKGYGRKPHYGQHFAPAAPIGTPADSPSLSDIGFVERPVRQYWCRTLEHTTGCVIATFIGGPLRTLTFCFRNIDPYPDWVAIPISEVADIRYTTQSWTREKQQSGRAVFADPQIWPPRATGQRAARQRNHWERWWPNGLPISPNW